MKRFIEVIEGGASRIDFRITDAEYEGLFTQNLFCCVAIIIIGNKGISLIHDTDKIRPKDIMDEFKFVGQVKNWMLVLHINADEQTALLNPEQFKILHPQGLFHSHRERLSNIAEQVDPKLIYPPDKGYIKSNLGMVCVTRSGEIIADKEPSQLMAPPNKELRLFINRINGCYAINDEKTMDLSKLLDPNNRLSAIDLQFEGKQFSNCSRLLAYKSNAIQFSNKISSSNLFLKDYLNNLYKDIENLFRILYMDKKNNELPSLTTALRRAAARGNLRDVENLSLILSQEEINEADKNPKSKRTALHWAVIKNHPDIVNYLVSIKADFTKKDSYGKTALDYTVDSKEVLSQLPDVMSKKLKSKPTGIYFTEKDQLIMSCVDEVQRSILTSHNIVNRMYYPHFHTISGIPELLVSFKARLAAYRSLSSALIEEHKELPLSKDVPETFRLLHKHSFVHQFISSLVMEKFGIGECVECSISLANKLIHRGYSEIAFIPINFVSRQLTMERGHQFLITNIKSMPYSPKQPLTLDEFWRLLPKGVKIVDPFLEILFEPDAIPKIFTDYLNAYGGVAHIAGCIHFYNFTSRSLLTYKRTADSVFKEMEKRLPICDEDKYNLESKIPVEDTSMIALLKKVTHLPFSAVRDEHFKVDAVTFLKPNDEKNAKSLQQNLKGYGRFFTVQSKGQSNKIFVLEGINLPEGKPSIAERIYSTLSQNTV